MSDVSAAKRSEGLPMPWDDLERSALLQIGASAANALLLIVAFYEFSPVTNCHLLRFSCEEFLYSNGTFTIAF